MQIYIVFCQDDDSKWISEFRELEHAQGYLKKIQSEGGGGYIKKGKTGDDFGHIN